MILFPPAKINLGLNVLKRREDGFHEIDSCMIAISFFDVLEILPSDKFTFIQTGLQIDGDLSTNLVVKAYNLLKAKYPIQPVFIHLQKHIPTGAGLGGGSSDATLTLIGLNQLFGLDLTTIEIQNLAAQLGSDCPFFATREPQLAGGTGVELTPCTLNLNGYFIKIVHPGVHISTKDAFENVACGTNEKSIAEVLQQPIETWKAELKNDFEASVFGKYPELENVKTQLYEEGAIYVSMSGSGSGFYGIYAMKPDLTFPDFVERVVKM